MRRSLISLIGLTTIIINTDHDKLIVAYYIQNNDTSANILLLTRASVNTEVVFPYIMAYKINFSKESLVRLFLWRKGMQGG